MSNAQNELFVPSYGDKEPYKAQPIKKNEPAEKVSWAFKNWEKFTEKDRAGLKNHLETLEKEKRKDYCKYLAEWCGVPRQILNLEGDEK